MEKSNIGIYKITSPTGRIYIGQSTNIEKRKKDYKFIKNCKRQIKLYNSFQKYGFLNHTFEIIEECSEDKLNEREIYWINFYNSTLDGLNIRLGGSGGGKNTEIQKLRLRECHKHRSFPILQYDLKGNFIKEWSSINEIHRTMNLEMSPLIQCLKNKRQTSSHGYQWLYKFNNLDNIGFIKNNKNKIINQINLENKEIINIFYNIKEAIKYLKLNSCGSGINAVLSGRQIKAYGFGWEYQKI